MYEPTAKGGLGDWTSVASMSTERRRYLGAGVLTGPNGNQLLYAAGGSPSNAGSSWSSVERYDPSSDTWASVASMSQERQYLDLTVIERSNGDRHLVAVGGYRTAGEGEESTVEQYDALTNTWTSLTSLPLPRKSCAVASVVFVPTFGVFLSRFQFSLCCRPWLGILSDPLPRRRCLHFLQLGLKFLERPTPSGAQALLCLPLLQ